MILLIAAFARGQASQCVNGTFRYQLKELVYYQAVLPFCSDYRQRTCCAPEHYDSLNKKILRTASPSATLSLSCRLALQAVLCFECDGDTGQALTSGVCPSYCSGVYESCKDDFFTYDAGMVRGCTPDDVVCARMSQILTREKACLGLGLPMGQHGQCWNGQSSHRMKGPATTVVKASQDQREEKEEKEDTEPFSAAKLTKSLANKLRQPKSLLVVLGWICMLLYMVGLSYQFVRESEVSQQVSNRKAMREARRRQQAESEARQ